MSLLYTKTAIIGIRMGASPKIPACIGIILDGNRRWAKEQGLPSFEGHRRGMDNIEPIALSLRDLGVRHLVVYAFSTENWDRSKEEVTYLMEIFETVARERLAKFSDQGMAVRFVGQRDELRPEFSSQTGRVACPSASP